MMDKDLYDRIEAYITQSMPESERNVFESDLLLDKNLAQQYELQKLEHDSMNALIANDLRAKMNQWKSKEFDKTSDDLEKKTNQKENSEKTYSFISNWKFISAISSIGLFALACFFIWQQKRDLGPIKINSDKVDTLQKKDTIKYVDDKLPIKEIHKKRDTGNQEKIDLTPSKNDYAYVELAESSYDLPEELFSSLKSNDVVMNTPYHLALKALNAKQYAEALVALGPPKSDDQSSQHYLRGHILFNLKKYAEAEKEFSFIAKDEMLPHNEEAKWYEFLCLLAQLPKSTIKFDSLSNILSNDAEFGYRSEVDKLLTNKNIK